MTPSKCRREAAESSSPSHPTATARLCDCVIAISLKAGARTTARAGGTTWNGLAPPRAAAIREETLGERSSKAMTLTALQTVIDYQDAWTNGDLDTAGSYLA